MFKNKEEQFDFYWKEIFTGLSYNPIEFNTYRFDQTMSLPGKVNKLYDMFKVLAMNNQEVMDYLKEFVETFDFKLETTIKDVLIVWLNEGLLADVVREAISEEVIEARTDYLGKEYVDLKERLDDERKEVILARGDAHTLGERLDDEKAEISGQLSEVVILASRFGVSPNNPDNHDAILEAVAYATQEGRTAVVQLPSGTLNTSPISFEGYSGFKLQGSVSKKFTWGKTPTRIRFISSGTVGLQFSDTTMPEPVWKCDGVFLEGFNISGNNLVNIGVNGNFNFSLEDITVGGCLKQGIVIEDYGYPVHFKNVQSSWNQGDGLLIRGKSTTKMDFYQCEFMSNQGYGIIVECGASVHFMDCTVQGNYRGGLKIIGKATTDFLQQMLFTNFYTEQNGKLLQNNPKYEGNWGILITKEQGGRTPTDLRFIGGLLNRADNGKTLKIDAVNNCYFDMRIPVVAGHVIEIAQTNDVKGLEFSSTTEDYDVLPGMSTSKSITSYYTRNLKGISYNGGLFPTRGRTTVLYYHVPSLANWGTVFGKPSTPALPGVVENGYPMLKEGSVLWVSIQRVGTATSGKITVTPMKKAGLVGSLTDGFTDKTGSAIFFDWDFATRGKYFSKLFSPGDFTFGDNDKIGFKFESKGHTPDTTEDGYILMMMVEY